MQLIRTMGVSFTALALVTTLAGTATAQDSSLAASAESAATTVADPAARTCYSNLGDDSGVAIVSQNFATADDVNDSAGADDFALTRRCKLESVSVVGQYFVGDGATSETVTIYRDRNGKPGKVRAQQTVEGADDAGSFVIPLDTVRLKPGTYWLSVVANLDWAAGAGGQWGWETTSNARRAAALWENPQDGFATSCTTWRNMQRCIGGGRGGDDFMFALN